MPLPPPLISPAFCGEFEELFEDYKSDIILQWCIGREVGIMFKWTHLLYGSSSVWD